MLAAVKDLGEVVLQLEPQSELSRQLDDPGAGEELKPLFEFFFDDIQASFQPSYEELKQFHLPPGDGLGELVLSVFL
ncbi:MAG TPA: hypothetical protein GX518_00835 [Firmicutes bacterium]|nr:hypothetical protein [Bacillota bacterium]